jgi:hypothetical protein
MDERHDHAEAGQSAAVPTSHRRPGPASIRRPPDRDPEPVTFGRVLRENPREVLAVVVGAMIGVVLGVRAVVAGHAATERILGAGAVVAALLLVASYALRFRPSVLEGAGWSRSPMRRVTRFVLVHAWGAYYTAALVVSLSVLAWRWWT